MSVRKEVAAKLAADWKTIPALAGLRVKATENLPDAIHEDLALIRQTSMGRAPQSPQGAWTVKLTLSIFSAHEDLDRAAEDLDGYVEAALEYLPKNFLHEDAELAKYENRLVYLIPLTITAKKEA
ncbi:hypothetical protein DBR36_01525 [Microbacterium sp. HMWF026]|uniref:hypothetical protein n=1 Tax=Microbacterium sp. HMWF026 TaxID=2056861 RepID=UPI000D3429F9|nr:hypothetical protein [Microbacterium sp. HMWF026]PTT22615.1 hypothetical protein DBR36_01525 [Microbacterium sp. HMWF026]